MKNLTNGRNMSMKKMNRVNSRINSSISAEDEWHIVKDVIANCVCVIDSYLSYLDGERT